MVALTRAARRAALGRARRDPAGGRSSRLEPPSLAYSRQALRRSACTPCSPCCPARTMGPPGWRRPWRHGTPRSPGCCSAAHGRGLVEQRSPGRFARSSAGFRPPQTEARALQRWYDWLLANVSAGAEALYPQALRLEGPAQRSSIPHSVLSTPAQAAAWFDAETGNLAAATLTANRHGLHRYAWLIADGLRGRSWQAPTAMDWLAVAGAALAAARSVGDGRASAAAYLCLADAAILTGDLDRAAEACTLAERKAARAGWLSGRAAALGNRGGIHRREGRYADALRDYDAAIELFGAAGRTAHKAAVYNNVGAIYLHLGAAARSIDFHRRALAIHRQTGSVGGEARSLHMLADALRALGQRDAAERSLLTALAAYGQLGDHAGETAIRSALSDLRADVDLAA